MSLLVRMFPCGRPPWAKMGLAGFLLGCQLGSAAAIGQVKNSAPRPASPEPVLVTVGQTHYRSLEKWVYQPAVVEALLDQKTARLVLEEAQASDGAILKGQVARVILPPPRSGYLLGAVSELIKSAALPPGTLQVKMLVENPASALSAGQPCGVEIQVVKRPHALVAPRAAILFEGQSTYVFRLNRGSGRAKVEKVAVHVGYSDETWAEISLGLWTGQWLATSNLEQLSPGAVVFAKPGSR